MQEEHIQLWANKLERETGVQLGKLQASHLPTQISLRMRELGLQDVDGYYAWVCNHPPEWQALLDRLLVKETHFFRNREVLQGVQRLVNQRIQDNTLGRNFDVWSLGCASGEEAYSLAAVLSDSYNLAPANHYFSVTGLDISNDALNIARSRRYHPARAALVNPSELSRYFDRSSGQLAVKNPIANRVTFVRGNLCELNRIANMPMDVIVCLNVLIYFRRWRRRELLNQLASRLKPGGLLIIGSGEMPGWQHPRLAPYALGGAQAYQLLQSSSVAD
ncbi:protein-glutamate O-methyltransferase CheR [Halioxenophilus sp. WMMB6]|uniref:CheR family methyltransferase n=1 Tax=Halioxenophilus sp. WMMB6 TaxID=3073815 RepID=UPI00295F19ED|nr:protein-glutamate O-methyltransferase CheR [Halioxenophilus sp. WMMB6]